MDHAKTEDAASQLKRIAPDPAEAATSESDDIAAIREHHRIMVEKVAHGYYFGCRLGEFAHEHRGVLLAALSRAPQPDTVTKILREMSEHPNPEVRDYAAALSARGRVG